MVQATFNISSNDFDHSLFDKIKSFIEGNDADIQVRIKRKESREEMRRRIEQAMEETERGENLISFTGEEYEALVKNLSTIMRNIQFQEKAYQEFVRWAEKDLDMFSKLTALFEISAATHLKGLVNLSR